MKHFTVVGMMSGTSLDGMDLVLARFSRKKEVWQYEILKAETTEYSAGWKKKLSTAPGMYAEEFMLLHNEYGSYVGRKVKEFLSDVTIRADLVSSHGHTIFHQPGRRFTFQLGSGIHIANESGITTVCDFRTQDVALGGQGAPLVPVGDRLLFGGYSFCLNLGGFANISKESRGSRIACDICPVNIVANELAARMEMEFDRDGMAGRKGKVIHQLVNDLNNLDFYRQTGPKSLGREWIESVFMPVIDRYQASAEDLLRSLYEHIAVQISSYINAYESGNVLLTGGGALNTYLVELIREKSKSAIEVPDDLLVKFKEALIFAFLGLLKYRNEVNCYASVTGALYDSSSGTVYSSAKALP
jgi:anhydro-N-acetylmuramic acid kinase